MNPKYISTFFKKHRYIVTIVSIFTLGLGLFALLIILDQRLPNSDDTVFPIQTLPYGNIIEWISYRYSNWSGRIFSEGFVYIFSSAPLFLWKIVNIAAYAVFVAVIFGFYKLTHSDKDLAKDSLLLSIALSLPLLANRVVFSDSIIWVTGSMVYLWVTALSLLAMYPIVHYAVKDKLPHLSLVALGIPASLIAASSQEQVGAVMLGLTLALLLFQFIKNRGRIRSHFPWYLLISTLLIGISLLISIKAPGNHERLQSEILTWQPDFDSVSLLTHIHYGYRWVLEAFINHSGFLLVIIWASYVALLAKKKQRSKLDYSLLTLFVITSVFLLSRGSDVIAPWLEFYATWNPTIPDKIGFFNLIPWGIVLITTIVTPLALFPKKKIGYLLALLLAASVASAAILVLSPTLYVSQWRTFFVPSVLLMVVGCLLLSKVLTTYAKYKYVIVISILSLALAGYIFQLVRLIYIF